MKTTITINEQTYKVTIEPKTRDDIRRRFHALHHDFEAIPFPEDAREGGPTNPAFVAYKKQYAEAMHPIFAALHSRLKPTFKDLGFRWVYNPKAGCTTCRCSPAYEQLAGLDAAQTIWISKEPTCEDCGEPYDMRPGETLCAPCKKQYDERDPK